MSYIEDFLEANMELPKDFIRNLKLIREIDEKVIGKYLLTKATKRESMKIKKNFAIK
jgi:hypothetical protein